MSFKTSVLIWFSRFRGTASPQANGVGLFFIRQKDTDKDIVTYEQKNILFNDISFGDRVTDEHEVVVTYFF